VRAGGEKKDGAQGVADLACLQVTSPLQRDWFRDYGSELRVEDFSCAHFKGSAAEHLGKSLRIRVEGLGIRVRGLGARIQGRKAS